MRRTLISPSLELIGLCLELGSVGRVNVVSLRAGNRRSLWGPLASLPSASFSVLGFVLCASPPRWGMQLEFDLRSLYFEFVTWAGPLPPPPTTLSAPLLLSLEVLMRMGPGGSGSIAH